MGEHIATANRLIQNLQNIDAHTALYLLINCLCPTKVLYSLRTSRFYSRTDLLRRYDDVICSKVSSIANTVVNATAHDQLTLPISLGGLGIRRTSELALPAFLAPVHSVFALASTSGTFNLDNYISDACVKWTNDTSLELPWHLHVLFRRHGINRSCN